MISLRAKPVLKDETPKLKGFDDFELTLGDVLRGERATQNKSLNDLKRELRIQPSYLLAIEEADPTGFDTPGFIAGYVRSYAKYLGLDPDWAFRKFCEESGFATAHGMSADASPRKKQEDAALVAAGPKDPFAENAAPFIPPSEPFFERVNFRAFGSILVLVLLLGGLGYGAMNVVQKVQQVQIVPIDSPVVVASDLDPLAQTGGAQVAALDDSDIVGPPTVGDLDRIYKIPQALSQPSFEPRDGPIATLDPAERGLFAERAGPIGGLPTIDRSASVAPGLTLDLGAAATELAAATDTPREEVVMFAVREVWARATAPDGTRVFQGIMQPGQEFAIPQTEVPVRLRAGNSGSLYFRVDGVIYGPAGRGTGVAKRVSMDREDLKEVYAVVETPEDPALIAYLEKRQDDQSVFVESQN